MTERRWIGETQQFCLSYLWASWWHQWSKPGGAGTEPTVTGICAGFDGSSYQACRTAVKRLENRGILTRVGGHHALQGAGACILPLTTPDGGPGRLLPVDLDRPEIALDALVLALEARAKGAPDAALQRRLKRYARVIRLALEVGTA